MILGLLIGLVIGSLIVYFLEAKRSKNQYEVDKLIDEINSKPSFSQIDPYFLDAKWSYISRNRIDNRMVVNKEEYHQIISTSEFLVNPTNHGRKSTYGELVGVYLGKRIYLKEK